MNAQSGNHKRVRLIAIQISVQAVSDDGQTLTPLEIAPAAIQASDLGKIPALVEESLKMMEEQINEDIKQEKDSA